jgi:hypothetical protein
LLSNLQALAPKEWTTSRVDSALNAMDTTRNRRIQYEEFVPWSYAEDAMPKGPPTQAFLYSTGALEWLHMRKQSNQRDHQAKTRIASLKGRGVPPVPW